MGLASEKPRREMYYMAMKAKKEVAGGQKINFAHFAVQKKDGQGNIIDCADEQGVSGLLTSINHGEYTHENRLQKKIWIILADGPRDFKIESNINTGLGRNLMNRVINLKELGEVEIRLWTDKEGNANMTMLVDGEKASWKYDYKKDLTPLVTVIDDPDNPGQKRNVYHAVNNKLLQDWIAMEPVIKKAAYELTKDNSTVDKTAPDAGDSEAKQHGTEYPSGNPADVQQGDDDLPF